MKQNKNMSTVLKTLSLEKDIFLLLEIRAQQHLRVCQASVSSYFPLVILYMTFLRYFSSLCKLSLKE